MSDILDTIEQEYKGYKISIDVLPDYDAESPRSWDNLGTMTCFHDRYTLGDEHDHKDAHCFVADLSDDEALMTAAYEDGLDSDEFDRALELAHKRAVILTLYLYDHSGLAMSSSSWVGRAHHAEWDSGRVGLVYVTHEDIRKEYNVKRVSKKVRAHVAKCLESEVETYSDYLSGAVYGYNATAENSDGDEIADDSCWGFFGYDDKDGYMIESACSNLKYAIDEDIEEVQAETARERLRRNKQVKTWIINSVPLQAREG